MSPSLRPASSSAVLAGVPRARLLPPEVELERKAKNRIRRLAWGLAGVAVLALVGTGLAFLQLSTAVISVVNEQSRAAMLVVEQKKYAAVTTIQTQISDIITIQPTAGAGEVLWNPFLAKVQATLPAGTTITAFTASIAGIAAPQVMQEPHLAIISITADSPQASVSDWLDGLAKLEGFVDATPGNVVLVPDTGRYEVSVDLLVNELALSLRFDPETLKAIEEAKAEAEETVDADGDGQPDAESAKKPVNLTAGQGN